jgi:thiol:disulfide interchange protein DsbD
MITEAQILQPAKWTYASNFTEARVGETIELVFKVQIEPNWYVYSTEFNCEDGPIKTSFRFSPHSSF